VIRKEHLNVFSNPNTAKLVEILKPKQAIIFGVALDLCIRQVVDELDRIGSIELYVLRDAVKALGLTGEADVINEFRSKGVRIISLADLARQL
jgi:hypothetical protein